MRFVAVRVVAVLAALALTAAVSACRASSSDEHGAQTPSDTSAVGAGVGTGVGSGTHNADDVAFLQEMIPHHEQAVDLSAMVPAHTTNAQLIALAQRIGYQQQSEIEGFRAQLTQWEAPLVGDPHGMKMEGMVDQATMDKLKTLNGSAFDKLWLHSMIAHHEGAITMAQTEIAHGQSPDIIGLAKSIVASQQAEVDQMNQMLGG